MITGDVWRFPELTSLSLLSLLKSSSDSNFAFWSGTTRGILKMNLGFGCSYNPMESKGNMPASDAGSFMECIIFKVPTARTKTSRIRLHQRPPAATARSCLCAPANGVTLTVGLSRQENLGLSSLAWEEPAGDAGQWLRHCAPKKRSCSVPGPVTAVPYRSRRPSRGAAGNTYESKVGCFMGFIC